MKFPIAGLVVLALALPSAARAQVDDQFSWGVNAGVAVPANYLAKDHSTGFNGGITFAFGGVGQLIGIRVDGMYNRFGEKSGTDAGSARILGATANLVMGVFGSGDRVYLTGGVGGYGIRTGVTGVKGVNDFGLNGGLGLWLPFANAFIEARYHHFYRALANKRPATFVPITLGVLF
jgi:hypothetical protein